MMDKKNYGVANSLEPRHLIILVTLSLVDDKEKGSSHAAWFGIGKPFQLRSHKPDPELAPLISNIVVKGPIHPWAGPFDVVLTSTFKACPSFLVISNLARIVFGIVARLITPIEYQKISYVMEIAFATHWMWAIVLLCLLLTLSFSFDGPPDLITSLVKWFTKTTTTWMVDGFAEVTIPQILGAKP
nr:hypothetical protein [Tanacetum cinerariifolium]